MSTDWFDLLSCIFLMLSPAGVIYTYLYLNNSYSILLSLYITALGFLMGYFIKFDIPELDKNDVDEDEDGDEGEPLKEWLQRNFVFKEKYFEMMKDHHITEISDITSLDYSDLKNLGIDDVVFRLKLYHVIHYKSDDSTRDYDTELVEIWLEQEMNLPYHYGQFMIMGYKDLESVAIMDEAIINNKFLYQSDGDWHRLKAGIAKLRSYYSEDQQTNYEQ